MAGRMRVLVGLMLAGAAAAQPAVEPDPPPLVVAADEPVLVWINGLEVALALSTGTVDHITLNDDSVQRIGLSASAPDNTADLVIGGRNVLKGRHGKGWLGHDWPAGGGRLVRREYYWFPGETRLPLAGTIGPFALPYWRVRVEWPVAATGASGVVTSLPLVGGIDQAAYGMTNVGSKRLLVGADVRRRRPLPLVTAATGADLAAQLGGRFVGEVWDEEILLGVSRPVRRLELDRPLMIGPIRIDAVAVRRGGPRDATASLSPGQLTPLDAEEDPEIMAVRGRILKQRRVARYIMLSRTQLEAAGCTSLLVDKAELTFSLSCAPPNRAPVAVAATSAVPVGQGAAPLIDPVLPTRPETALALGEPLALMIDGRPLRLVPGDAGAEGIMLNGRAAEQLVSARLQRLGADPQLPGQLADLLRRAGTADLFARAAAMPMPGAALDRIGMTSSPAAPQTRLNLMDVDLASGGVRAQAVASWLEIAMRSGTRGDDSAPFDGRIALAALPDTRLRLRLGPVPSGGTIADLALAIADRSHDQGVMGVTALPGIDALFVGLEWGKGVDLPVVSLTLGQDLMRLNGGIYTGPVARFRNADKRLRLLRPLQLATPLVVGPLRLERVLVQQEPGLLRLAADQRWTRFAPWPDWKGYAGLERELRLPPAVLLAAGCHELVMDKPGRAWTLRCGALNAAPAPAAGAAPRPPDQSR